MVLEGSTGYTKYPFMNGVPEKIYNYGIRPKFIYMVRNPFERITSHYFHNRANEGSKKSLSESLDYYINVSNYYMQLKQYEAFFPREDILVLDFSDYKREPDKLVSQCCEFIGVSDDFLSNKDSDDGTQNKTHYYSKTQMTIDNSRILSGLATLTPKPLKDFLRKNMFELGQKEEMLTQQDKDKIVGMLESDMKTLSQRYGVDVSKWGF